MDEDLKKVISDFSNDIRSLTESHNHLRQDVQESYKLSSEIANNFSTLSSKGTKMERGIEIFECLKR